MPFPQDDDLPALALIGFGAFGRLMAMHLRAYYRVYAVDPGIGARGYDAALGVEFADISVVARCGIVVLAVPVERLGEAVAAVSPWLREGALVLDVGSVKVEPVRVMLAGLPEHVDIVGTHPLFGPQSGRDGIAGLKIAVCPVRGERARRVAAVLRRAFGLKVILTSVEKHDREMAVVQGLTHLVAKIVMELEVPESAMSTASFDRLIEAVDMVRHDAPGVTRAIAEANPYAAEVRRRFFDEAERLRGNPG